MYPDDIRAAFKLRGIVFDEAVFDIILSVFKQDRLDFIEDLWLEYGISVPNEETM